MNVPASESTPEKDPSAYPASPDDSASPVGGWALKYQRMARIALATILALLGLWVLYDFLVPLTWAAIFAIATWPSYLRFLRILPHNFERRALAPLAFTLLVGLFFLVPLGLVAVELGREAFVLLRWMQQIERDGLPVPAAVDHIPVLGSYIAEWWQANLTDPRVAVRLLGRMEQGDIVAWTRTVGSQLIRRSSDLIFTLLTLFFLYRDGPRLIGQIDRLHRKLFGASGETLGAIVSAVRGTVNGLVLVGLAEGAVLGLAFWVLGLPDAVLLATLTAVLAAIPFGAFVMFTGGALMLLTQSEPGAALGLFGFGMIVLLVADQFVRPFLIGGAAKLPFLWVLLGIVGGLESIGLLGLFVGPAVMASVIALWRELTTETPPALADQMDT